MDAYEISTDILIGLLVLIYVVPLIACFFDPDDNN